MSIMSVLYFTKYIGIRRQTCQEIIQVLKLLARRGIYTAMTYIDASNITLLDHIERCGDPWNEFDTTAMKLSIS